MPHKPIASVYAPPAPGLPHLVVFFSSAGKVISAEAVRSLEEGNALVRSVLDELAQELGPDEAGGGSQPH